MSWLPWALGSAVFAGLTAVLAKAGVSHVDANLATALRTSVIVLFTWGIAAGTMPPGALGAVDRRAGLFLVLSAVATGLSWLCYFRALQLGPVTKVAPIDKLSVVVALGLAMAVFGERLSLRESCGAGLLVLGAVLLAWK